MPTIWQPLKLARPLDAVLLRPPVQDSVAPLPGWVLMDSVTVLESVLTTVPEASSTATTGCWLQAAPLAPPPGWVVNATLVGVLTVMLIVTPAGELPDAPIAYTVCDPADSPAGIE